MPLPTPLPQIHIISLGAISKLLTFSLLSAHPTLPICLILRPSHAALQHQSRTIPLTLDNKSLPESSSQNLTAYSASDLLEGSIQHLILPTKSAAALPATEALLRAGKFNQDGATILGTQNGLGTLEGLCEMFPDSRKFSILAGIMNHGVYSTSPFSAVHAGKADMLVGNARSQSTHGNYLAELLTSTPDLKTTFEASPQKLLLGRLRKLAVNAVINPLTAILDVQNGILYSEDVYPHIEPVIAMMIEEISAVTSAILISSVESTKEDQNLDKSWLDESLQLLSVSNLSNHVRAVGYATAQNISSMRADILAGRLSEVDVINGAIVRGGQSHGIDTPVNGAVVARIREREAGGPKIAIQDLKREILGSVR